MKHPNTFSRYLTEREEKALFKAVKDTSGLYAERDLAWMRLLRATGMRVGETSLLTCGHARDALRNDHLELQSDIRKKKVAHTIFCTGKCKRALRDLLRIRRDLGHAEDADAPLIMSRNGKGMSIRSFQSRLAIWRDKAGLEGVTPHWFRHTVAKRIMKNSTSRDPRGVVQSVLGHKAASSTDVYTRTDKEDVVESMKEVC